MSSRPAARLLGRQVVPGAVAALFALPLWFMLVGSLRPTGQPPPTGAERWPPNPTLESYRRLPDLMPVLTYLGNSALVWCRHTPPGPVDDK